MTKMAAIAITTERMLSPLRLKLRRFPILDHLHHITIPKGGISPYAFVYPATLLATLLGGWEAGIARVGIRDIAQT